MKKLVFLFITLGVLSSSKAQFIKRIAERAKNKNEQKNVDKVDKTNDYATDGKKI